VRVLVTGASGFVGRPLVERLAAGGADVTALVAPDDDAGASALAERGVRVVRGDVAVRGDLDAAVAGSEVVYHLAGLVGARRARRDDYARVNVQGTRNVAEAASAARAAHLVHVSTVGVHGNPARATADETAPFAPLNAYQGSKLAAESEIRRVVRDHGLSATIARLTTLYGPGDRRALPLFRDVARGRIVVVGDGRLPYQMTHVADAVTALLRCGERRRDPGEAFFVGSDERTTVGAIIDLVARAVGTSPRIVRLPRLPVALAWRAQRRLVRALARGDRGIASLPVPGLFDRLDFFLAARTWDVSKAERELGFLAAVPLSRGIAETARWYRDRGWLS